MVPAHKGFSRSWGSIFPALSFTPYSRGFRIVHALHLTSHMSLRKVVCATEVPFCKIEKRSKALLDLSLFGSATNFSVTAQRIKMGFTGICQISGSKIVQLFSNRWRKIKGTNHFFNGQTIEEVIFSND